MVKTRTAIHIDAVYENHVMPAGHPERTDRIRCLLDRRSLYDMEGIERFGAGRAAEMEDLLRVHDRGYVDRLAGTAGRQHTMLDPDTHTSEKSWETALLAAGGVIETIDGVVSGRAENGLALIRPPGHHAEPGRAMGFCLLNNVAIGARYLQSVHGLKRILVVDWDVHHGNGTQRAFYDDGDVLFVSIHQSPCYPGTGAAGETGEGGGAGFTVNIPLPPGCGDPEYASVFDRIVTPVAREFAPEFVLVSAGFDAHRDDPLAGMSVTRSGYRTMAAAVVDVARESCGGRLVAVLEGGYNLGALVSSVETVAGVLSGASDPRRVTAGNSAPLDEAAARSLCQPVIGIQSRFWRL